MTTVNEEYKPSVEQIENEIEPDHKRESWEQVKTNQEIEPIQKPKSAVQREREGEIESMQKPKRGRPRKSKKFRILMNLKNCTTKRSPPQYKIPEPEQWESRLRQGGRESVLNKIKTVSEHLRVVERQERKMKNRELREKLDLLNIPDICFVKVEDSVRNSDGNSGVKIENNSILNGEDHSAKTAKTSYESQHTKNIRSTCLQKMQKRRLVRLQRIRMAEKMRRQMETGEQRLARLQRMRMAEKMRRQMETGEQRLARLERMRIAAKMRRQIETGEQRRMRLESAKNAQRQRRPWKEKSLKTVGDHKKIKLQALCNLVHSICSTQHSHHPQEHQRLPTFDNVCTTRSSNYILRAVVWHKLNRSDCTDEDRN